MACSVCVCMYPFICSHSSAILLLVILSVNFPWHLCSLSLILFCLPKTACFHIIFHHSLSLLPRAVLYIYQPQKWTLINASVGIAHFIVPKSLGPSSYSFHSHWLLFVFINTSYPKCMPETDVQEEL